ncbi:MAG: Radical SAM domain protein, partial [Mesotoga infera]
LIPKPGTPFEGMPMEPIGNLRKYEREIRSELVLEGMKIDFESLRESKLQFALANIDKERSGELLGYVERGIDPTPILNKYAEEVNLRRKEWNKHGKEEYSGR